MPMSDSLQTPQGNVNRLPPEPLDERRRRWINLLRNHHYEPVILDILNDELPKYTTSRAIDPTDLVSHARQCALILASAPRVFFAAVEGTLVSGILHDTDLIADYATMQQRSCRQPSIYIHLLADDQGIAPTPNQYIVIRDMMQNYVSGDQPEHVYHIDNVTPPAVTVNASSGGYRKYLHTQSTDRSPRRVATLETFRKGITLRCAKTPAHLHDTPFSHPPSEVGYALNVHKRLKQHRARQSSNYIMNLVEDICTHLFRTTVFSQHFKMHQFIIYLIFRPSQAAIAEIFCSGLLQCWIDNGGGFNSYPAGRSVGSSERVSRESWLDHERVTRETSPLEERTEVLKERAEVWRKVLGMEDGDNGTAGAEVEEPKEGVDDIMDVG